MQYVCLFLFIVFYIKTIGELIYLIMCCVQKMTRIHFHFQFPFVVHSVKKTIVEVKVTSCWKVHTYTCCNARLRTRALTLCILVHYCILYS